MDVSTTKMIQIKKKDAYQHEICVTKKYWIWFSKV